MNNFIKFILSTCLILSLTACSVSSQRLSEAEQTAPVSKVNVKLQKYIEQLYSQDATERAWAAYNIGKSAKLAGNAAAYLIAVLNDNDTAVMSRYVGRDYTSAMTTTTANEAVKALAKIGRPAVKSLLLALKDSNSDVVIKAIKTLGLINDNESIKPLVSFLSNKDKRIRLEAANSLSRFKNPWVTDYLLTTLKNNDPAIRATALYALGKLKSPVAVPDLLLLLNDPDTSIRSQVLYVLSKFRDERIIQPLIDHAMVARENTSEVNYRIEVISALGNIRDYRVIEALIVILEDKNKNIKTAAAGALAQIADVNLGASPSKWKRWWSNKLKRSRKK